MFIAISITRMRRNQKPVLIFDVMSLCAMLCTSTEEILCSGRHQMFSRILDKLFARLSSDAELVFFQDGQIADTKFATWSKRQNKKYDREIRTMEMIYDEVPLSKIAKGYVYTKTMMTAIEETCKNYALNYYYAVNAECDQELARFAYSNSRVLAVFSNDSDFLIFPGSWRYFSVKDLDLETLETKEFNRVALHATLKLNSQRLAVLATIAGNDIVLHEDLKKFHDSLGCSGISKFRVLAKFIKNNFADKLNLQKTLDILAEIIFRETEKNLYDLLKSSIEFYDVVTKSSEPENPYNVFLQQHNLFTYQLLNKSPTNLSLVYFDCREGDMPLYFDLSVPLVRRQAGVLFIHSQCDIPHLKIYSKKYHNSEYEKFTMLPLWPPFSVPVLEKLLSDDPEFDESRFQLLKWTVAWEHLKGFDLREIPSRYIIDVLTLVFLRQGEAITSKEADLILWTIKNVENGTIVRNIQPPEVLDQRAFRVAFIYVKSFANVARSFEVCGLKKRYWVSWLHLDSGNFNVNLNFSTETMQLRWRFLPPRVQFLQEP